MGRKKGICTLCGQGGKLTFEHVPAEASGNLRGVTMHSLDEWLKRDRDSWKLPGGVPQPEGLGLFALCRGCNVDLLGVHYVPAFVDFVQAGKEMLADIIDRVPEIDARDRNTEAAARFLAVNRLAVAKQIASMMLVTSGRGVVVANPALQQFVRTPTARGLPSQYRLFLALTPGPAAKVTGLSAIVDTSTGQQSVVTEVVYPPFAYALSFNGSNAYPAGEITDWASAEYGQVTEHELRLPLGFCHTAFPADLRTHAQIERTIRENEAAKSDRHE